MLVHVTHTSGFLPITTYQLVSRHKKLNLCESVQLIFFSLTYFKWQFLYLRNKSFSFHFTNVAGECAYRNDSMIRSSYQNPPFCVVALWLVHLKLQRIFGIGILATNLIHIILIVGTLSQRHTSGSTIFIFFCFSCLWLKGFPFALLT